MYWLRAVCWERDNSIHLQTLFHTHTSVSHFPSLQWHTHTMYVTKALISSGTIFSCLVTHRVLQSINRKSATILISVTAKMEKTLLKCEHLLPFVVIWISLVFGQSVRWKHFQVFFGNYHASVWNLTVERWQDFKSAVGTDMQPMYQTKLKPRIL